MRKAFHKAFRNTFRTKHAFEAIDTRWVALHRSRRIAAQGEQHEHVGESEHVGGHEHVRGPEHVGEYEHIGVQYNKLFQRATPLFVYRFVYFWSYINYFHI